MGIMNGYQNGEFGPNDTVTRAQLAQVIYNYNENVVDPLLFQVGRLHQKGRKELEGSSWLEYGQNMNYYQLEYSLGDEGEPPYDKNEDYFNKVPAGWVVAADNTEELNGASYGTKIIALDGWKTSKTWFYIWYDSEIGISGTYGFFYDDVNRLVQESQQQQ